MNNCKTCGRAKQTYMNSKFVCLHCDELLFDMEIELDGSGQTPKRATEPASESKAKLYKFADKAKTTKEAQSPEAEATSDEEADRKTKKAA